MTETEGHPLLDPLLDKVLTLAREKGLDWRSQESVEEILQQIDNRHFDPRTVLILGDLVERLLTFDRQLGDENEEGQASGKLDLSL